MKLFQSRKGGEIGHLIILGGGSAAFAAAIRARENGARVTIINDGLPIGGTCVNVGCVPSKTLIWAAETLYRARHSPFDGIESAGDLKDFAALIGQKDLLVDQLRQEKYLDILKKLEGVELIEGRGRLESAVSVRVGERLVEGSHVLIATGARPMIPPIAGLSEVGYLTSKEAFELETLPESLLVIGGSYIALEIAQLFTRLGSRVTLLQRSERILSAHPPEIGNGLAGYLAEEGMEIVTGNMIQSVSEEKGRILVRSLVEGELRSFRAEKLLVATGRRPNTEGLNLKALGIETDEKGGIVVNEYLQTKEPTVYAAGDVLGERMFVYTAAYEGSLAADNAFGPEARIRLEDPLPWVIFTDPQVAGVGLDVIEARQRGIDAEAVVLPMHQVPRAIAARETRGFIQLIRNRSNDTLIGARILASEGSEMLMEVTLAIRYGVTVKDLREMLHPYLTLGEGIKLAAVAFDRDVDTLSCCAT